MKILNADEDEKWFWEVENSIYDLDQDLLVDSLMGAAIASLQETLFMPDGFIKWINQELIYQSS